MDRKDFLRNMGLGLGLGLMTDGLSAFTPAPSVRTAADLQAYLRTLKEVPEPSTDRIIVGDPTTVIKKVATCWMPYWEVCKKAYDQGVNVIVAHEPTFFTHMDLQENQGDYYAAVAPMKEKYIQARDEKKKWILDHGMVIIRCHDVIDKLKDIGMPFALGQAIGLRNDQIIRSRDFYNVYQVPPMKARDAAAMIAKGLKEGGQPGVGFYGDPNRVVKTIGVGCGYICDPLLFGDLEPDLYICINDAIKTWIQGEYSRDSGQPMVVIDHGTSEEYGMRLLNKFLNQNLKGLEFIHVKTGCTYEWVV